MARARKCSECENLLEGRLSNAKTCSNACRNKRSRRLRRARKQGGRPPLPEHQRVLSQAANGAVKDLAHEVAKEELRPVVREAITDDVLKAIDGLVKLTPQAIQALTLDLASSDDQVRQKATALILRYTLGNQSVAPAPAEQQPAPMQVVFNMPRPGSTEPGVSVDSGTAEIPEAVEDTRECQDCREWKVDAEFVAGSDRCQSCYDGLQARIAERFGGD